MAAVVDDHRGKFGTYSVKTLSGIVNIDLDAGPKSCAVTTTVRGVRLRRIVMGWEMPSVWLALGRYAPNA